MCYEWRWDDARRGFLRSLELSRGYPTGHHWYAEYLLAVGNLDEAIAEARRAQELDPLGLIVNAVVGMAYYYARRYDEAIAECTRTIAMEPSFAPAHVWLGLAYLGAGRPADAVRVFEKERRLTGERSATTAWCGVAYARDGQRRRCEQVLTRLIESEHRSYVPALDLALLQLALGRRSDALHWLERAYQERSVMLGWIQVDPLLDELRHEARFTSVADAVAAGRVPPTRLSSASPPVGTVQGKRKP
jgi:tetratricopeptide (TPR) repeat protein